jgi:iron complex outermembrane receptor protein
MSILIKNKNRIFLLIVIWMLSVTCIQAQSRIQGRIIEVTGEALAYANVLLYNAGDSSLVKAEISSEDGTFAFNDLSPDTYYCEVSMIGFTTLNTEVLQINNNKNDWAFADIILTTSTELKEVEIVARKAMIEVRADMLVFNVSASPGASGIIGLELLKRAPGVAVDMDDNILLLGKNDVQIHINGRPTQLKGSDLAMLLQNMNSDNIEAIEIISNPSSKYDAEGNAGVINLRLKKNPATGLNGSLNASFTQGNYLRYNNGLTINYGGERVRGTLDINRSEENIQDDFIDKRQQNNFILDLNSDEVRRRVGYNIGLGLDAQLSKNHTLGFTGRTIINQSDNLLRSNTGITPLGSQQINELLVSETILNGDFNNLNFNLNYRWQMDQSSVLSADAGYGKFISLGFTEQPNTFFAADGMTVLSVSNNEFNADTYIDMWSAKADYEKSWDRLTLSAGGKFTNISTDNQFNFFNLGADGPVLNNDKSNDFLYTEQVLAGYTILDLRLNKFFKLGAGLRVEQTTSRGRLTSTQNNDNTDVPRNYTDFFPNASLSFNNNRSHAISISAGRRLTRPNYENLNPFESPLSELSAWKGNPFLRPNYIMNYQITYSLMQKLTITAQFSETKDMFATIFEITGENSTILIPYNMNKSTRFSFSASYPLELTKFWELNTFFDAGRSTFHGNLEGTEIELSQNTWNIRIQNNIKLPWDILLDLSYQRGSDWIWRGSIRVNGNQSIDFGLRKDFFQKRLQVRITGADIFLSNNEFFYAGNYGGLDIVGVRTFDSRRFGAGATWKFGNQKVKEAKRSKGAMEEEIKRLNSVD